MHELPGVVGSGASTAMVGTGDPILQLTGHPGSAVGVVELGVDPAHPDVEQGLGPVGVGSVSRAGQAGVARRDGNLSGSACGLDRQPFRFRGGGGPAASSRSTFPMVSFWTMTSAARSRQNAFGHRDCSGDGVDITSDAADMEAPSSTRPAVGGMGTAARGSGRHRPERPRTPALCGVRAPGPRRASRPPRTPRGP